MEAQHYNKQLSGIALKLGILASVVTILGLPIAISQLHDILDAKLNRSIDLLNNYDLQLSLGTNPEIRYALEDGRPVLITNGGKFTEDQLGDYIDIYATMLGDTYENNLISESALCDDQCYYLESLFGNQEILTYVKKIQNAEGPSVWSNLAQEAFRIIKSDEGAPSSTLRLLSTQT